MADPDEQNEFIDEFNVYQKAYQSQRERMRQSLLDWKDAEDVLALMEYEATQVKSMSTDKQLELHQQRVLVWRMIRNVSFHSARMQDHQKQLLDVKRHFIGIDTSGLPIESYLLDDAVALPQHIAEEMFGEQPQPQRRQREDQQGLPIPVDDTDGDNDGDDDPHAAVNAWNENVE